MDATILYHPELPLTNMLMDEVGEKLFLKRLTTIPGIYTNYFRYKDIIISLLQSTAGLMPLLSHATFLSHTILGNSHPAPGSHLAQVFTPFGLLYVNLCGYPHHM